MKRRNFFQSLAAVAGALVLPKAREADSVIETGQGDITIGHPSKVHLMGYDVTYSIEEPAKITGNARTDGSVLPGTVVSIDDGGMLKACTKEQPPVGVVESSSCETHPITGRTSYFAEIIIKS